jgi:hypothetical protein
MNTWVIFSGTLISGGQGTWRNSAGGSGIAIYNSDGSVTCT